MSGTRDAVARFRCMGYIRERRVTGRMDLPVSCLAYEAWRCGSHPRRLGGEGTPPRYGFYPTRNARKSPSLPVPGHAFPPPRRTCRWVQREDRLEAPPPRLRLIPSDDTNWIPIYPRPPSLFRPPAFASFFFLPIARGTSCSSQFHVFPVSCFSTFRRHDQSLDESPSVVNATAARDR